MIVIAVVLAVAVVAVFAQPAKAASGFPPRQGRPYHGPPEYPAVFNGKKTLAKENGPPLAQDPAFLNSLGVRPEGNRPDGAPIGSIGGNDWASVVWNKKAKR